MLTDNLLVFEELEIGDRIKVESDNGTIAEIDCLGKYITERGSRHIVYFDKSMSLITTIDLNRFKKAFTFVSKAPRKVKEKEGCTCDTRTMSWQGCKCGWFQKEQSK